jgi:hypothetical protein
MAVLIMKADLELSNLIPEAIIFVHMPKEIKIQPII